MSDEKLVALRQSHPLHPHPDQVVNAILIEVHPNIWGIMPACPLSRKQHEGGGSEAG